MPHDSQTTRKIIQITACQVQETQQTQCEMMLFALCDDGTVWQSDNRDRPWFPVKPIPQGELP